MIEPALPRLCKNLMPVVIYKGATNTEPEAVATGSMYAKLNKRQLRIPYDDPVATAPGSVFVDQ